MSHLTLLYLNACRAAADVPYPVRLRAAHWWAGHAPAANQADVLTALAPADAIAVLATLATHQDRVPAWAVAAALSSPQMPPGPARAVLRRHRRRDVRAQVAARSASPAVLGMLCQDGEHPQVLTGLARNPAATHAQRLWALRELDAHLAGSTPAVRRAARDELWVLDEVPPAVLDQLVAVVTAPEMAARLARETLSAAAAVTLLRTHLAPALADPARAVEALGACDQLLGHEHPAVRSALTAALTSLGAPARRRLPRPLRALVADEPAPAPPRLADVARALGWADAGADRPAVRAELDALAGLDEDGWTAFEALADTFTGSMAELVQVAAGVAAGQVRP